MATWRNYGAGVLVSAGVLVTGVLVYDRYPTGEAAAELAGAAWERAVVSRLTGTNPPALWYAKGTVSTNGGAVTTNYTGMAAVSPYMRNDQIRYFLDQLRSTIQEEDLEDFSAPGGGAVGNIWWLDPDTDPDTALAGGVLTSYVTPQYEPTEGRWSSSNGDYFPTGGVRWVRNGDVTDVTATPNLFTLNSLFLPTNRLAAGLFGWNMAAGRTSKDNVYVFAPTAVFPRHLADSYAGWAHAADFGSVGLSKFPWAAAGSHWLCSGLHTDKQWQLLGDETLTTGVVKRTSWITGKSYDLGTNMSGSCTRTLAVVMPVPGPNTVYTERTRRVNALEEDPELDDVSTEETTNSFSWAAGTGHTLAYADWEYDKHYTYDDLTGITHDIYYLDADDEGWFWATTNHTHGVVGGTSWYANVDSKYVESTHISKAVLPYPSAYAVTNGYVARIRVYTVCVAYDRATETISPFATDKGTLFGTGGYFSGTYENVIRGFPTSWTRSTDATVAVANEGFRYTSDDETDYFTLGIQAQGYNPVPGFSVDVGTRQFNGDPSASTAGLASVKVKKILTVESPSSYPVELPDLGPATAISPPSSGDYYGYVHLVETWTYSNYGADPYPPNMETSARSGTKLVYDTWDRKRTKREVELVALLVVVDWDWKHMNPGTPFVPETFTPGWLK